MGKFNQKLNEQDRLKCEADLIKAGYSESGARMMSKTATYATDGEMQHHENNTKQPNPPNTRKKTQ